MSNLTKKLHAYGVSAKASELLEDQLDALDGQVTPGAAVADLAGGATLPTTVTKVNELLASLRAAGLIET